MDLSGFLTFMLLASLVLLIAAGLERLFLHAVPVQILHDIIRMPGVVLHETAHVLGCLITGAGIQKVVLFSRGGGSVTYSKPALPFFGDLVISMAPIVVLPVVLACLTWLFGTALGCFLPLLLPPAPATFSGILQMVGSTIDIFTTNTVTRINGWFFLYLYLTTSIILALSPSGQDLKNAFSGIIAFTGLSLLVIWTGSSPAVALLTLIITPLWTVVSLGILFELIVFVASVPFLMISLMLKR